jgi:hypothetical protein
LLVTPLFSVALKYDHLLIHSLPQHILFMFHLFIAVTMTDVWLLYQVSAHRLALILGLNKLRAAELHGNLSQQQRLGNSLN